MSIADLPTLPKHSKVYKDLGFEYKKTVNHLGKTKYLAICQLCDSNLTNTSMSRLQQHRNCCNGIKRQVKRSFAAIFDKKNITVGQQLRQFYVKLGFRPTKMKKSNGVVKNVAICLICNNDICNTSLKRLKAHRNVCFSETYKNKSHNVVDQINKEDSSIESTYLENEENSNIANSKPMKLGRKQGKYYDLLGFRCLRILNKSGKPKTVATCLVCNRNLHNTCSERLINHRKTCNSEQYNLELTTEEILICTDNKSSDTKEKCEIVYGNVEHSNSKCNLKEINNSLMISAPSNIREAIASFVFACSLPLNITDSVPFKALIASLNQSCLPDIPKSYELSTCLLTEYYDKYLEEAKKLWVCDESVMILDSVVCRSGQTFLVSLLQDAITGSNVFLNCLELKGKLSEDAVFDKMVVDSLELARVLYNTNVYAVVTDKMVNNSFSLIDDSIWYITSQSFLAGLVLKDLLATLNYKTCLFKTNCLADELKNTKFSNKFHKSSQLGVDVDNLYFLTENWNDLCENFDNLEVTCDVKKTLLDKTYKRACYSCLEQINLLSAFVNRLSSPTCSLADSIILWQNFVKNPMVQDSNVLKTLANQRYIQAKTDYSLIAHYFGEGRSFQFSDKELTTIQCFLNKVLSVQAKDELKSFENAEYPSISIRDEFYKSADFWEMMKEEMPYLSAFALKMLKIPGSSRLIKNIFFNFRTNDDVGTEQARKLMAVYFNLLSK